MRRTRRIADLAVDFHEPSGALRAAVLFVHGFGSRRDGEKATYLGDTLSADGIAFLAPDLRGHGESGGDLAAITIERSIEDLRCVAGEPLFRDAPRRVLAGSSFGGLVAAWAAAEDPGLCERLALIAPAFGFIERHVAELPPGRAEAWRRGEPLRVEREWITFDLDNRILLEAERRPVSDLARRLDRPTLILHGRNDESVPLRASEEFARSCPAVELCVIEDGDHRLVDHKETLGRRILAFVRG
jgi:pimeloyl-ACP methyl ester carboxylesterase